MSGIYLALGSNLGNRAANMSLALRMLAPLVRVEAVSKLYESAPQAPAPGPDYLNAACRVVTGLTPHDLVRHAQRVEHEIGRRPGERWAPRPIDIDIALYEDVQVESELLTLPHPRIAERAFVLQPLLDLDAGLTLPDGRRVADLLASLGDGGLTVVEEPGWERVAIAAS